MTAALSLAVGTTFAADLERLQGEDMTGTPNTVKTASAIRFDGNGRAYKARTQSGVGYALYFNVRSAAASTSRVCFRPRIDSVLQGTRQCIAASQTSYVLKGQPLNVPAGATVGVEASGIDGPDALFLDYALVRSGSSATQPQETDLDGGYDDALTHESMDELTQFVAWLRKAPGAEGYVGEIGWPQNTSRSREEFAPDERQWNDLGETWYRRADAAGLSVTAQEASERYANTADGGYSASVYMQCGNLDCPGFPSGERPLALTKEGYQAAVVEAHPTTASYFRGLNFSGGQAWDRGINTNANPGAYTDAGGGYFYPTTEGPATHDGLDSFEYLASQGIMHVRLGVRWERIQPQVGAPLDETEMARHDEAIGNARAAGLKVIVDLHNYGGYWDATSGGLDGLGKRALGSTRLESAEFEDVWLRLSAQYKDDPAVVMYDLMNEPSGASGIVPDVGSTEPETWEGMTRRVVNAIRTSGDGTRILVPSYEAGIGSTPEAQPQGPWITGQPNLIYGAHHYFDHYVGSGTGGGRYSSSYAEENTISANKGF